MKHRNTLSLLAVSVIALLLTTHLGFASDWSGNITNHVTWTANSDITIVSSLTVTSTGWLTVERGVTIDGDGIATLTVASGGKLEIGETSGSAVKIDSLVSISLIECEGTTLITNTNFTNCGDPSGINPFISLNGGEGDGYRFISCSFDTIISPTMHWEGGSKGEVGTCGWFPWAGSPIIIGPGNGNAIYLAIHDNDFDGSCGWFPWAGSPLIAAPVGGGTPCNIVIEDNNFTGLSNAGVGVHVDGATHDDELTSGQFDIRMERNKYYDLEIGIELEDGAEASSMLISNNVFYSSQTGISLTSTSAAPVLATIANNALFDNTTGAYISLNGNAIPDGLTITNTVAWENEVGFDFAFANSASMSDLLFRNNIAGESSTAGFRSNVSVSAASIHHMGLKGNVSNIKVGSSAESMDRFASDCIVDAVNGKSFSLVNENPGTAGWDFHLLVDDSWSGDYNNLINSGYDTDPDNYTADIGLFGGSKAAGNIDKDFNILANYRSVTSMEFFNDVTSWKPDIYRLNIASPSINMTSTGTIDGGSSSNPTIIEIPSGVTLLVSDNFRVEYATFKGINSSAWKGFKFNSTSSIDYSGFSYCTILDGEYGLYLTGLDDASGDRLPVTDCTIDACGVAVYANQSRLNLTRVAITGSNGSSFGGSGIYLTSCSSGKILIDDCTITGNGTGGSYSSAGIYLSSSSPEIINTLIEDNSGAGVTCFSSTPDMNTWNSSTSSDRPNSIHSDGGQTQSGSDGAEIYLASSSYPDIQYNNIWDYSNGPVGYMIYKHSTSNSSALVPSNNWWGANPTSSFFYWGAGSAIDFSAYSGSQLSSAQRFAQAMSAWDAGDYVRAAEYFSECVWDNGAIGINSVHYLSGCYAKIPQSDYRELRRFLSRVSRRHQDAEVAKIAARFATDCLTELGEFEDAMEEYEEVMEDANCLNDRVMAEVDWLSVYDLAHGTDLDAVSFDVPARMSKAFAELEREQNGFTQSLPGDFSLNNVYPNPFNGFTRINYSVPETANLQITVHDLSGRQVAELFHGLVEAGNHSTIWNAEGASAGVYMVKVNFAGSISSQKLLLVK